MTQNAERRMRVQDGQVVDDLDARQMAAEDLMLGMRMARGVSDERVARRRRSSTAPKRVGARGWPQRPLRPRAARSSSPSMNWPDLGLVEHADGRWRPTDAGWLCGNELYGRLLDLAP